MPIKYVIKMKLAYIGHFSQNAIIDAFSSSIWLNLGILAGWEHNGSFDIKDQLIFKIFSKSKYISLLYKNIRIFSNWGYDYNLERLVSTN